MRKSILISILFIAFAGNLFSQILPNPKISGGKTVYTSKGSITYLTDNKFNSTAWTVSDDSWIAIMVDKGPSKIFFNWNNPSYAWSNELAPSQCPQTITFPVNYDLLTSSNSTNGNDGDWVIADSIRNNIVCTRGHLIHFTGQTWVKMHIIKGGGQIDEIQVFDASDGDEDVWFFAGTSISANTFKGTPPTNNYADLVTAKHADYNPAMIRGGIGCISSSDLLRNISKYLKMAGNAHFWAIEMGTNDAWGGTNGNVALFKSNMQTVIDSCKVAGIHPVIAKVLATNATLAGWQINPDFEKAIDDLTANNNLNRGPDLYTWFLSHPEELNSDGIHPNAAGAATIQRLWSEKMDSLYGGCSGTEIVPYIQVNQEEKTLIASISVNSRDTVTLSPTAGINGTWKWSGPNDFVSTSREIMLNYIQPTQSGNYVVTYTNGNSCSSTYSIKITAKNKTEIDRIDLSANIFICPNPATDGKIMVTMNELIDPSVIQIFDLQGVLVYHSMLTQAKSEIITRLEKGTYIVQVINGRYSINQKLVIN